MRQIMSSRTMSGHYRDIRTYTATGLSHSSYNYSSYVQRSITVIRQSSHNLLDHLNQLFYVRPLARLDLETSSHNLLERL